jgi:hypothetical protein
MINRFNSLNVNFSKLSTELGLSYTLSANDIDFNNLKRSYITNDCEISESVVAPFKSNSTSTSVLYAFLLTTNPGKSFYIKPMIVRVVPNQQKKFFDLNEGYILTLNNYHNSNITTQITLGDYLMGPGQGGCGQATMDCIADVYSKRGWLSVWVWVQTAYIPHSSSHCSTMCF